MAARADCDGCLEQVANGTEWVVVVDIVFVSCVGVKASHDGQFEMAKMAVSMSNTIDMVGFCL